MSRRSLHFLYFSLSQPLRCGCRGWLGAAADLPTCERLTAAPQGKAGFLSKTVPFVLVQRRPAEQARGARASAGTIRGCSRSRGRVGLGGGPSPLAVQYGPTSTAAWPACCSGGGLRGGGRRADEVSRWEIVVGQPPDRPEGPRGACYRTPQLNLLCPPPLANSFVPSWLSIIMRAVPQVRAACAAELFDWEKATADLRELLGCADGGERAEWEAALETVTMMAGAQLNLHWARLCAESVQAEIGLRRPIRRDTLRGAAAAGQQRLLEVRARVESTMSIPWMRLSDLAFTCLLGDLAGAAESPRRRSGLHSAGSPRHGTRTSTAGAKMA